MYGGANNPRRLVSLNLDFNPSLELSLSWIQGKPLFEVI